MVLANVQKKAEVRTDGWKGYNNLHGLGYSHIAVPIRENQAKTDKHLPMIHIVFGNLDAWLLGTHHGVSSAHLQGYLAESVAGNTNGMCGMGSRGVELVGMDVSELLTLLNKAPGDE